MFKISAQDKNEIKLTWGLNIGKLELTINADKKVYAVVIKSKKKFYIQGERLTGIPSGVKKTQDVQGIKELFDQVIPKAEYINRMDNYAIHFEKREHKEVVDPHSDEEDVYEDIRKYGNTQDEMMAKAKEDLQARKQKHKKLMEQMYQDLDDDRGRDMAKISEINKQTQALANRNADLERQIAEMQAAMREKKPQDSKSDECSSCNIL